MEDKVRLFVSEGEYFIILFLTELRENFTFYRIKAPFNGVLVQANITEGSLIRPGQVLGNLALVITS